MAKYLRDQEIENNKVNWWDAPNHEKGTFSLKDDTPLDIKAHPEYKKRIGRYLHEHFADKDLQTLKAGSAKATINFEDIDEEKEREGYYPNELD